MNTKEAKKRYDQLATPIVCYAEDWARLPSSTQHLMRGLSKTHKILWIDSLGLRTPSATPGDMKRIIAKIMKNFAGAKEVEPNIFTMAPIVVPMFHLAIVRWVNRLLLKLYIGRFLRNHQVHTFIQWSSCPTSAIMIGALKEAANVYYIGDEFSEFTQFDASLVHRLENEQMVSSDLMFVVSDRLMETKSRFNPHINKIPHGCDFEHFSSVQKLTKHDIPQELRRINGPVIGYYGLIRDWFDFEMLKNIFSRRKDWSLVLIGPHDTDLSLINNLPNVHLLGPKPYEQLPFYIRGFDICLIPYRKTEITVAANPLKLLEYLSSGKPVVSTDLPSVHPYREGLQLADSEAEMEQVLADTIDGKNIPPKEVGMEIARTNSWQSRIEKVEQAMERDVYPLIYPDSHQARPVVLHLIAGMGIAGAEKVLLNLLSQSSRSSYDLRVASFVRKEDGAGVELLRASAKLGAVVDRIPISIKKGWDISNLLAMRRLIRRHGAEIVHTHGYKSDIVGSIAGRWAGIPVVATAHGFTSSDGRLGLNEKIGRMFLKRVRKIIAVSKNVQTVLVQTGINENKILTIPNAVDFEYFAGEAELDFRSEWQVAEGEILIGTAGRLSYEKNQLDLIRAFSKLAPELMRKCKLVIAGEGELADQLVQATRDSDLTDRVIFPGFVHDMRSFYKALDLFCLPSIVEASPLTVLEAAATGCPVIASNVGSIGELIIDGTDGFLIEPKDSYHLAACLSLLAGSSHKLVQLGALLRNKLRKDYDLHTWSDRIFAVYDSVRADRS
ncbi:MAG: glycosyltransferase [candidate division Zixibacteria bacterium]|nr:glycosyltransferase [candidate division Zixibacteria bacterium]